MRIIRVFVIVLVIFCFIFLPNTFAMEFPTALPPIRLSFLVAKISPPHANEPVHYSFEYKVPNFHDIHDWIEICFPPGTQFQPPLPLEGEDRQDRLIQITDAIFFEGTVYTMNCTIIQGLPVVTYNEDKTISIRFPLPFSMDPTLEQWDTLTIHCSPEAGIVTPPQSGKIAFALRTESSPRWKVAEAIEILGLEPGKTRLYLKESFADRNSAYLVECIAGKGTFDLENPILVHFAPEIKMPHTIRLEDIQINGERPEQVSYPMVSVVIDPPTETSVVDFCVKMYFDPKHIPHMHDQIEINLGVYGDIYTVTLKENPNSTVLIAFYFNRPIEKGYYTLKMKWKDNTATCSYSIPFEDESIFLFQ